MNRRTWLASVGTALLVSRLPGRRARARDTTYLLDDSGPLPVAISFVWYSEVVAHALAGPAPGRRHVVANDAVRELTITGTVADQQTSLRYRASSKHDAYDPGLHTYTTSPVSSTELARLLDPGSNATFTLDLRFRLLSFFDALLAHMTRTDERLRNIAYPEDSSAILRTFERHVDDGKVVIDYHAETHRIEGVPCKLVDVSVTPQGGSRPPAVELLFEIDFHTKIDDARREAMRKLVAMDWSGLSEVGKKLGPLPPHAEVWRENVLAFLADQTDMQRAERFRTALVARHAHKPPKQLASDLRDDIDAYIITANHWGEAREDFRRERHQALLSDLMGNLHQIISPASPIHLSRALAKAYRLGLDQQAALTLQYGTGFCGEHSRTTFSILRTIMGVPGSQLESIVLSGNANVDHGFVLCNLQVTEVIHTTATNPVNTRVDVGEDLKVFNLREAIAKNGGREILVVDPYLDPSMIGSTADSLLRSLNSKKKKRRGKDTDFLKFELQFPEPHEFAVEDIRDRPLAERMRLVKNV